MWALSTSLDDASVIALISNVDLSEGGVAYTSAKL